MRLVAKLTLLLMLGTSIILAVDGYLTVRRERAHFARDMQTDTLLFGGLFADAIREVWRTQGRERTLAVLDRANVNAVGVEVRWVWLDEHAPGPPAHLSAAALTRLRRGDSVTVHLNGEDGHLHTYIPVSVAGDRGALDLALPLRPKHVYTRATVRRTVVLVTITVIACTALALVLSIWLVGRPIRSLVARTRAIGAGDLEGRLVVRRRDELGILAGEVNAMSQRLLEARERVAQETERRIRAVQQLRHADRLATVGTLAAGLAHELGTPLNIIGERAAMVEHGQLPAERVPDNARIIREQSERITGIVRQLLDFARSRILARSRRDVGELVRTTVELLHGYARNREVSIALEYSADEPLCAHIDAEQIRQALTNLVMNAVQASPRGATVSLAVSREHAVPPSDLRNATAGSYLCVRVTDRGGGIARDHLAHIFEPFFTTKDIGEGTGLGLSVTYGIVREHGGWIDVDTEVGEGTRFALYLPEGDRA